MINLGVNNNPHVRCIFEEDQQQLVFFKKYENYAERIGLKTEKVGKLLLDGRILSNGRISTVNDETEMPILGKEGILYKVNVQEVARICKVSDRWARNILREFVCVFQELNEKIIVKSENDLKLSTEVKVKRMSEVSCEKGKFLMDYERQEFYKIHENGTNVEGRLHEDLVVRPVEDHVLFLVAHEGHTIRLTFKKWESAVIFLIIWQNIFLKLLKSRNFIQRAQKS
jgi:hypothetical protein